MPQGLGGLHESLPTNISPMIFAFSNLMIQIREKCIIIVLSSKLVSLTLIQIGGAIASNPGYLKLRKIRAAQNIARTVSPDSY